MAEPRGDVEQGLALLDTYNRQIEGLSRQLSFLQTLLNETARARDALEGLKEEQSDEILVPVGANTFLYAQATRKDKILSGIGAGLSMEKTTEDAVGLLADREKEIQAEMQRLSEAAVRIQQEAGALQEQLQEAMGPESASQGSR